MVRVPSAEEVAAKWQRRVAIAGPEYQAGVTDPGVDWAGPTKAAEGRYGEGVTKAISEKRFGKGVSKAGNEKWKTKTSTLGVERWGSGVLAATDDYAKGMAPVLAAEASAILPP
ncbi:hypothetical protein KA005_02455, partial [bacterium]|nr:hypothetical protein [bacterium]